jgi:cytidine deaminase
VRKIYTELLRVANQAKKSAHAPYSGFRVGAALLTTKGTTYTGCNIETSSYSLTICAERTAIFKAISEGERNFRAIAIATDATELTPPCGACRQVLLDLAGNIDVLLTNGRKHSSPKKLRQFLPHAFTGRNLKRTRKRKKS